MVRVEFFTLNSILNTKAFHTLYNQLVNELRTSDANQRIAWAHHIIDVQISLLALSKILYEEERTARRFTWLLSDIGLVHPETLREAIPQLFRERKQVPLPNFERAFCSYWRIAGIPEEQEGEAIDLLFGWLMDANVNVHVKNHALECLQKLAEKYPDLKHELELVLHEQLDKNTATFRKKAMKALESLKG